MNELHSSAADGAPQHHAYAIAGDRDAAREHVLDFLQSKCGEARVGNPDIMLVETTALAVSDSRALREHAGARGTRGRRYFIVSFESATNEAQNALLKLLEEPPTGAYFFVLVPSFGILLPTVRSRLSLVRERAIGIAPDDEAATSFRKGSLADRLKMIDAIVKRSRDDATKAEAQQKARALAQGIVRTWRTEIDPAKDDTNALADAARALEYLHDRSPSLKMLLEYLAVTVPLPTR